MALMTVLGTEIADMKCRGMALRTEVLRVRRPALFRSEARHPERYLSQEAKRGRQS
jgi:hypothetical protein